MTRFTFHTDSGHGWLEVSVADLHAVRMAPHDFSSCSYMAPGRVYLEEDCDAAKFVNAWRNMFTEFETVENYVDGDSFIRRLNHIRSRERVSA